MIDLYTAPTPNGYKVSILLEELGMPYEVHPIALENLEQRTEAFLKINPNGRIPAIVDREEDDLPVFESGAILIYLAEKAGRFLPTERRARARVLEWLMFQMAGVGPMQGQANVFFRYAPERIPFAISRYQNEVKRLYGVLDRALSEREHLADDYSIADMATWPWVAIREFAGVSMDDLPNLQRWFERVGKREAVQRGIQVPVPMQLDETSLDRVRAAAGKILQR